MNTLIAREAPDFWAPAVMPNGVIEDNFRLSDLRGKYVVLFFWPLDFTFVCPTEIIAHHHRVAQFKERGVEVVGILKKTAKSVRPAGKKGIPA
jgi:peroxiredoxin 2/4